MTQVGARIFANKDGQLLATIGQYEGESVIPKPHAEGVVCIDLDYNAYDWDTEEIIGVDMETMTPIIKKLPILETDEQRRIRELEDTLLLQANSENGGIL
ncbi:hypothetical protein ACOMCU_26370 [Lysinibacillus sp. UGB7]|uniref:hypothetical protein n=1 Tax=Lysinibacillus sp. UGB7 TaxID=3411039 RepID=UPI003B791D07